MLALSKAFAIATLLSMSSIAKACECAGFPLVTRSAHAQVIVVAEVESVLYRKVVIRPIEVLKGQVPGIIVIATGSSMCDYFLMPEIPIGAKYLLFLNQENGEVVANRCLESGPLAEKKADLEALRKLSKR